MKLLIVTRADDKIKFYTKYTIPLIKRYAKFCNADFLILSHNPPFLTNDNAPHYRSIKVMEILDIYDRVLMLDADTLINKNCPDLFKIVPEEQIGSVFEDKGTRKLLRKKWIKDVQQEWGDVGWKNGYTNMGVYLVSKTHKNIFSSVNGEYWVRNGSENVHVGYQTHKYGFIIFELSYKFNHMRAFSEPWNYCANKFNSYIIHYAGIKNFLTLFKSDYNYLFYNRPKPFKMNDFLSFIRKIITLKQFIIYSKEIFRIENLSFSQKLKKFLEYFKNFIFYIRYW